jgi:hypothetical protein
VQHQLGRKRRGTRELARSARAFALVVHRRVETRHVDLEAALARDVGGQVHRETVGVVQTKGIHAGDRTRRARSHFLEHAHALLQRFGETLFLAAQRGLDERLLLRELRIRLAHLAHQRRDHLVEEELLRAELPAVAQRAPDDPAQHVATPLVRRQHAVDDEERARADVVGDHAQRLVLEVLRARELACRRDQPLEQIDLVIRVHVLQHGRQSLQSHAGVDARRGQRRERAVDTAIELHEHEVPDLDVPIAIFVRRTRRTAGDAGAVVVEDFRARTARTGVGHLPEIVGGVRGALVVADAHDALARYADVAGPQIVGLVVRRVHGHPELLAGQAVDLREQLPRVADRVALEVVAEAEVAQHLEERVVARGVTDLVEVVVLAARAHAALARNGALVRALLGAEEHVLELDHPGIREQQRGIVARHERARGNDLVPLRAEELEKGLADLGAGLHGNAAEKREG